MDCPAGENYWIVYLVTIVLGTLFGISLLGVATYKFYKDYKTIKSLLTGETEQNFLLTFNRQCKILDTNSGQAVMRLPYQLFFSTKKPANAAPDSTIFRNQDQIERDNAAELGEGAVGGAVGGAAESKDLNDM